MTTLDLSEVPSDAALDLSHLVAPLAPDELALVVHTWRGRMVNEHISARIFSGLVYDLMRAGYHGAPLFEASAMAREELTHARLCATVVRALGAAPVADLPELLPLPDHLADDAARTPREALAMNLLSVACLSETVAVAQISAERDASDPALADVLTRILADEVGHARLGWALLDELVPAMTTDERTRLSAYLAVALAALAEHQRNVGADPRSCPGPALRALGVCDGRLQHAIYLDTVEDIILPRLAALGLDGENAWARLVRPAPPDAVAVNAHQR